MHPPLRHMGVWVALAVLGSCPAAAQFSTLSGRVFDAESAAPLPGATILVLQPDSLIAAGTVTNESGRYRFLNLPVGEYVVVARFVGYQEESRNLRLRETPRGLNFRLNRDVVGLDEVEVASERQQEASDTRTSIFRITPAQALQLAGGGNDVLSVLQTLPGVLATSDFSNQLIVRGGNPDQNLIILDDIEVFNPYRLNGMASMFNPIIVRDVELYTGGFPAEYGDRLSSVLSVATREGTRDKRLGGELNLSLSNANLVLEGKTGFWDGSWLIGGRRTYFDLFAGRISREANVFNDVAFPDFVDAQVKLVLRPARGHRLQLQGLYNRDQLDWLVKDEVGEQGEEFDRLDGDDATENTLIGASYTIAPSANLQGKITANWYRISGSSAFAGELIPSDELLGQGLNPNDPPQAPVFGTGDEIQFAFDQDYAFRKAAFGGGLTWTRGAHTLDLGGSLDFLRNTLDLHLETNDFGQTVFDALQSAPNWFGVLADSVDQRDPYTRLSAYAQDRWTLMQERLFIQPGLRYDYYQISGQGYVSPRLSASYALTPETTLRGAFGLYRQSPGYEKLLDEGEVFNLARYAALDNLAAESAQHVVVSLQQQLGERWNAKLEGYWKTLDELIVQQSAEVTRLTARYRGIGGTADPDSYRIDEEQAFALTPIPANDARGEAYGLELLVEKQLAANTDRWSGWASYAYASAEREEIIRGERIRYPFDYDRRHAVNVVFNYKFGGFFSWVLGVTWRYGTGFPYTPAVGIDPLIGSAVNPENPDETVNVILTDDRTGDIRFVPDFGGADNLNSERLPDYHRLDVRFTYTGTWLERPLEFYVDFVNIYGRKNVLYYRSIVEIEDFDGVPGQSERTARPALFREPVFMLPFVPSLGLRVKF